MIKSGKKAYGFIGRKMSKEDLQRLAEDLIIETNIESLKLYINIFSTIRFPLDPKFLIEHLQVQDEEVQSSILMCLKFFKGEEIRQIGLDFIKQGKLIDDSLNLLTENFMDTDSELITLIIGKENDDEEIHRIGITLRDIYEKNLTPTCYGPLTILYQKGYCALCREHAIELMIKAEVLPDWIKEEAKLDCNFETRKLVK